MTLGRSIILADVKPEFIHLFAKPLERMGFRVRVSNPGQVGGFEHADSNPFKIVADLASDPARQHEASTVADSMGKAAIPDVNDGKAKFFTQLDQSIFSTVLLELAVLRPSRCYPAQIWKHIFDPELFLDLQFEAKNSDALHGDLASLARSALEKDKSNPEHIESARTGAANALSPFKPGSLLGSLGANHDFDIEELRNPNEPPLVLIDVVPNDQLEVFSRVNEIVNASRLQSLKRNRDGREVVYFADEATALPCRAWAQEIELIRSFNLRFVPAYQSYSSLKRVLGEARAESLRTNSAQVYFSVNDLKTAKEISERVGDQTIKTESFGFGENRMPSRNVGETGRRLLPPEELLSLSRDEAILLMPGLRPVRFTTVPYYEIAPLKHLVEQNPHEQHAKSNITKIEIRYGSSANELGPPVIPDWDARLKHAQRASNVVVQKPRTPLLNPMKLIWIPLAIAIWTVFLNVGTPHLAWMQSPARNGGWTCGYLGIAGFEIVSSSNDCPFVAWLPPHAEEL